MQIINFSFEIFLNRYPFGYIPRVRRPHKHRHKRKHIRHRALRHGYLNYEQPAHCCNAGLLVRMCARDNRILGQIHDLCCKTQIRQLAKPHPLE